MAGNHSRPLYEEALELARGANYDKAQGYALLRQAHDGGDARATYAIATWYLFGVHVEKDPVVACGYLTQAAEAGVADAMYDLAVSYEKGIGVDKDTETAFEYYLRAALHGDHNAVFDVSRCYFWGIGIQQDRRIADIWADRAKALGVYEADEANPEENILKFPGSVDQGRPE